MFCSYYFIWQTKYSFSKESVQNEDVINQSVVDIANEENAYLEEQEDGSYVFYFYGNAMEVSSEDVKSGLYDFYPIIEYESDKNFLDTIFLNLNNIIKKYFN